MFFCTLFIANPLVLRSCKLIGYSEWPGSIVELKKDDTLEPPPSLRSMNSASLLIALGLTLRDYLEFILEVA
jgi:hypothetical protein